MSRAGLWTVALVLAALAGAAVWYLASDHEDDIAALNLKVLNLHTEGKDAQAAAFGEQAAARAERALGKDHGKTLNAVSTLADIYYTQKRYAEAAQLYERLLEADERILGEGHRDTLAVMKELAAAYQAKGRHDLAEPLLKRRFEISGGRHGKDHPHARASASDRPERKEEADAKAPAAAPTFAQRLSDDEQKSVESRIGELLKAGTQGSNSPGGPICGGNGGALRRGRPRACRRFVLARCAASGDQPCFRGRAVGAPGARHQ